MGHGSGAAQTVIEGRKTMGFFIGGFEIIFMLVFFFGDHHHDCDHRKKSEAVE